MPINAAPHAAPTIAASEIGVSITRSLPKRSINPSVTLNAPPYAPTSSPIKNTVGSRSISSQIPARMASTIVAAPPRGGCSSLRSFLTAVAMLILLALALLQNFGGNVRALGIYDQTLSFRIDYHVQILHRN